MKIEMSYFVKLENGTNAWLSVGAEIPEGAIIIEERPMIMSAEGKALKHKITGRISTGHWLREGSADDWEEIEAPKEN